MAMSKSNMTSFIMLLRNSLPSLTLRLRSNTSTSSPTTTEQSIETRPRKPAPPINRFITKRRKELWSGLHKEAGKIWEEMSEEAKRPYVEKYNLAKERWTAEKASMTSVLEALEGNPPENSRYSGFDLFRSEVKVPSNLLVNFLPVAAKKWNDLSPEERESFNERALEIKEKGQNELLSLTLQGLKMGRPISGNIRFRNEYLSSKLKGLDLGKEWAELSDEEKDEYHKPYTADMERFRAEKLKYKKTGKNRRNLRNIKASIKQIEQEMNFPASVAGNAFHLFFSERMEALKGLQGAQLLKNASILWQALSEEERIDYRAKWNSQRADWAKEVAECERINADNPKMAELKAYREMWRAAGGRKPRQ